MKRLIWPWVFVGLILLNFPSPHTSLAYASPLKGDTTCRYGDKVCSPCVQRLLEAISRPSLDVTHRDFSYRIRTEGSGLEGVFKNHIQGVARLADMVRDGQRIGRMVLTENVFGDDGLIYAEHISVEGEEALFSENRDLHKADSIRIREIYDHPGGAQAHGDMVVVGMEQGRDPYPAAVYLLQFPPGARGGIVNRLRLDGSHGEPPGEERQEGASAAAFLKLASGRFLLAVSGTDHGKQGIWFYESSEPVIRPRTHWRYVDFWKPPCTSGAGSLGECFGGASGMALVTDCSGDIYLVTMHGTDGSFGSEYQWIQVYQVEQSPSGEVDLWLRYWQRDNTGWIQTNNPAFRWAGGLYVTEDHNIAIFNTERRTNEGSNSHINGDVYIGEGGGDAPILGPIFQSWEILAAMALAIWG